ATPADTASKVSNGRTTAPDGVTSILMRPSEASSIDFASRRALGSTPGPSGQSVTMVRWRTDCPTAGAATPSAAAPAPERTSLRFIRTPSCCRAGTGFVLVYAARQGRLESTDC